MADRSLKYTDKTFDDYKQSLKEMIATYYPEMATDFNDASIGSWLIDMVAAIGDNLSYHMDSIYSETQLDSAQQTNSIFSIARSNGLKVPGPKGAMVEVKFTCKLKPSDNKEDGSNYYAPEWKYAPIIRRGTLLSASNGQYFEILNDIDFTEQFNEMGISNRTITPYTRNGAGVEYYEVTKTEMAVAGASKVKSYSIGASDIVPFKEYVIPERGIMNVESIIFKTGVGKDTAPYLNEFYIGCEQLKASQSSPTVYRYFEVDSLLEQYRWGDDVDNNIAGNQDNAKPKRYTYMDDGKQVCTITKGAWLPLTQKFITEYTDNGYLKITFGSGSQSKVDISEATSFSQSQITKIINNELLGKTPIPDTTMYVRYRVGGGYSSNLPAGSVNKIASLNDTPRFVFTDVKDTAEYAKVINSLTVESTTPSVSGKDMPTVDEIRNMIKYNNAEQNRCVTPKDYEIRIAKMPSRYGTPFRCKAIEANNKIMIYMLNVNANGKLTSIMPSMLVKNVQKYLSMYRCINDYVEIKTGRVINVSFEVDIFVDRNYVADNVALNVLNTIKDYMDIDKHYLGDDIFVGDLMKEIGSIDGVLNLIDIRVYNNVGDGDEGSYSNIQTSQEIIARDGEYENGVYEIDLDASDYILNSEPDEMFEIKNPDIDIKVRCKTR